MTSRKRERPKSAKGPRSSDEKARKKREKRASDKKATRLLEAEAVLKDHEGRTMLQHFGTGDPARPGSSAPRNSPGDSPDDGRADGSQSRGAGVAEDEAAARRAAELEQLLRAMREARGDPNREENLDSACALSKGDQTFW